MKTKLAIIAFGLLLTSRSYSDEFDAKIAPILARRCLDCHSGTDPKGKLDLSRREPAFAGGKTGAAILAGKPDESPLWERVRDDEMPPKRPLTGDEKAALRQWITQGARWGTETIDPYQATTERRAGRDWWALQPLTKPTQPEVRSQKTDLTPIDRFVLAKLEAKELTPSPEADRRALIRRLTFDLTGLPPTIEEIDQFVHDTSLQAYEKLVDRLLASPQYGVRWARWWLDLARFGESNGFEFDEFRPNAWRYRDWVVDSLNKDMHYDEFVRLQIAGDVLNPGDPSSIEATGFLVANPYDTVGQKQQSLAMKAVVRSDEVEDYVGTVGQTFLGLTIHCARCHDHKFDPIRQTEYYQIASALAGVQPGDRNLSSLDSTYQELATKAKSERSHLDAIEDAARTRVRAQRDAKPVAPPAPFAAWDFDRGLEDRVGKLHVTLKGGATRDGEGLKLDGKTGFASTPAIPVEFQAKTIEAWVKLANLDQRGSGVISIEAIGGGSFDAIVFGELEPRRWMAGSEGFRRYQSVNGPVETLANDQFFHVAITYSSEGYTQIYRDGQPYGQPYKSSGLATFTKGESEVVFGMRHAPAGGNKMLAGTILRARLYDRTLDPAEVAGSAGTISDFVSTAEIISALTDAEKSERDRVRGELKGIEAELAKAQRTVYAVNPRPAGIEKVQLRGNPKTLGDVVSPGGVASIVGVSADFKLSADAPEGERRKQLANWITDPKNPLFSRVLVNRLWQSHFGVGLVETPSDFGFNAGLPSHPELLDWLARRLIAENYRLKPIHKEMVMSATYRQASTYRPAAAEVDAGNRLLWRKSPTRLEAEMVRDAMFAAAGQLDMTLGGPSFRDQVANQAPGTAAMLYSPLDPSGPGLNRRTLYRAAARGRRNTFLDAFDCPDPSTTTPRRAVTITPLQALAMMNNSLVLYLADQWEVRLKAESGADFAKQAELAYQLGLGRAPTPEELAKASQVIENYGAAVLARALYNSNEFLYVD